MFYLKNLFHGNKFLLLGGAYMSWAERAHDIIIEIISRNSRERESEFGREREGVARSSL